MINYHHIGGRNGTFPLPLKEGVLLDNFHLVLYDADANCFNQMERVSEGGWGKTSVFPYCIGGKTQRATFNLNFHPTTNSLYPFNTAYADYGYVSNPMYGEYRLGDACKHVKSVDLDLFSLEDVLQSTNITSVDFLSLDVQGAEFDILQGAKKRLQQECVGVQLEVEFVELYSGQKSFFDIHALLDGMGFELIEMEGFGRCAPISLPIGYRGTEQPLSAEAIYVKKLSQLVEADNIELIYKAAFFNLLYKKLGLCIKYINYAISIEGEAKFRLSTTPLYQKLLWEIWSLYKNDELYTFPSIAQLMSNQSFQEFYQHGKNSLLLQDKSLKQAIERLLTHVDLLSKNNDSPLELLLRKYALGDVADSVKQNRQYETECLHKLKKQFSKETVT